MKSFYCRSGNVSVEEIGASRTSFEPNRPYVEAVIKMKDRLARSRSIRQQNRNRTGKI